MTEYTDPAPQDPEDYERMNKNEICKCGHEKFLHEINLVKGYVCHHNWGFGGCPCKRFQPENQNETERLAEHLVDEYEKPEVVILDDNPLSIVSYAEEYPENFKEICKALEKSKINSNEGKMENYKDIVLGFRTFLLNLTSEEEKYMSHHVYEILCHELQILDHELEKLDKKLGK